jgi:hypothetical protein
MNGIEDYLLRDWHMLVGREHGPLSFRMVLQPLVATAFAIRPGLQDARAERWTAPSLSAEGMCQPRSTAYERQLCHRRTSRWWAKPLGAFLTESVSSCRDIERSRYEDRTLEERMFRD